MPGSTNPLNTQPAAPNDSVRFGFAITPSDTKDLASTTRAIYVGASGDLAVEWLDGGTSVLLDVASGVWHPMAVRKVLSTGTSATGLVGGT